MRTFREYVDRRDEASYNPFRNVGVGGNLGGIAGKALGGEGGDLLKYFGHVPGAAAGAGPAIVGGLGQTASKYRSMSRGNPYISDTPQQTKALAGKAFNDSSAWLLNYVAREQVPQARQKKTAVLNKALSDLENHFHSQQPQKITGTGVTVGKQPTTLGNVFALPVSLIAGIKSAAKNVIDTMNPAYQSQENEWLVNIEKMVLSLDALNRVSGPELVDSAIQTFLHNIHYGGDAKAREIGRS